MTTPVWDVDTDGSALAWVRHSAGTVALSAGDGGGDWISFQQTGTREGLTLDQVPCAESTFRLDRLPAGGRLALRFALAGTDLRLYDYGVVLL